MATSFKCRSRSEREAYSRGFRIVAGIDEVGRGCLFGPVFAAAVVLDPGKPIRGLRDSKLLPEDRREILAARIRERAIGFAVAAADVYEIDELNILQASRLAMKRAVEKLTPRPDFLLVDAVSVDAGIEQEAIIHGDAKVQCIAAASILAKVERDACMKRWDEVFPRYGLAANNGYGTPEHMAALRQFGPTSMHRFSFEPVRENCRWEAWQGYPVAQQRRLFDEPSGEAAYA